MKLLKSLKPVSGGDGHGSEAELVVCETAAAVTEEVVAEH